MPADSGRVALGVDVGGTKVAAGVVNADGAVLARHEVPTPRFADAEAVFEAVCAAAQGAVDDAVMTAAALAGIGLASAGPIDRIAGTVSPVNIGAWRGFPLRERLAGRFGLPVRLLGDGIAIAIAEHWLGAARGRANALGMVVSTGVGGGLVLGGRVHFGATGNAGHIGHSWADPAGPVCACGAVGCLEAIASGTSLARWYAEQRAGQAGLGFIADDAAHGSRPAVEGAGLGDGTGPVPVTAAEIAAAARAGDPLALAAFERAGTALGSAIAGAVALLDLNVVVIGGGVGRAFDLLSGPLNAAYARAAGLDFVKSPRVIAAALGGDTGVLGAAAVVLHPHRYWTED